MKIRAYNTQNQNNTKFPTRQTISVDDIYKQVAYAPARDLDSKTFSQKKQPIFCFFEKRPYLCTTIQ